MKVGRALSLFVLIAACRVPCGWAGEAAPLGRFDYLPYPVSVSVAFSRDSEITEAFRHSVCSSLAARLEQTFGAVFSFPSGAGVRPNEQLSAADESGLDDLTYSSAAEHLSGAACEKAYFLTVRRQGPRWLVAGREWDKTLQSLGSTVTETTFERRCVPDAALAAIKRLFSPLLMVNDADRQSKSAVLTIRAGAIPFGDPKFQPLRAGDILRPVFRFLDSKRAVRSIQSVPWTYLVLDHDVQGHSQLTASVISSYRAPLAANMRRRVEAIAVRVRPELSETHLKLVAGRNPEQPQGGLFVSISELSIGKGAGRPSANLATIAEAKPAEPAKTQLLSDRGGEVTIPADPQHPIVRLEVHSGTAILARRPFAPGIDADVTLQVSDDHVRLATEREIDILESQLIETVAKRGSLIARARAALGRAEVPAAQQAIAEIERLPAGDEYFAQLNKIRVLALEEARRRKDRVSERRIEDLSKKTFDRITQYLPDDRIQMFKEQIAELLKAKKVAIEQLNAPLRRGGAEIERAKAADKAPLRRGAPKKPSSPLKREPRPAEASGI
jgi:hypothetical protein